jgi:menaquinone-dependent protoporphyrinogen oxidase
MNILVAYASAHGSTAQVANVIGQVLTARGVNVAVANVTQLDNIQGFDAIVLGSAIHNGALLKEMSAFCRKFGEALATKPTYLWLSCIRVLEPDGESHVLDYYLDHAIIDPIHLRDIAVFAGKLDLEHIDWNERWTLAARYDGSTWPSNFDGDYRDWTKIRVWAERIAAELKPVQIGSLQTSSI